MKRLIVCLGLVILVAVTAGLAIAQNTGQEERAASGNNSTVGVSSRVDLTQTKIRRFINTQEAILNQPRENITTLDLTFTRRIGLMTDALVNVSGVGGCDPDAGPHACKPKCACGGPDQKLLWTGNDWQCYQAACPPGQTFNQNACRCEGICQPPQGGCPPGYHWDPVLCQCKCDVGTCVCPPPRIKDQYGICNCPSGTNTCQAGGNVMCITCSQGYIYNPATCGCETDCENNPGLPGCANACILNPALCTTSCNLTPDNCPAGTSFNEDACVCECNTSNCTSTSPVTCPAGTVAVGGSCRIINNCPNGQSPGPNGECVPICP